MFSEGRIDLTKKEEDIMDRHNFRKQVKNFSGFWETVEEQVKKKRSYGITEE